MSELAIIGLGSMGTYSALALASKFSRITGYDANIQGKDLDSRIEIASSYENAVKDADVVLFAVPTYFVDEVMRRTLPHVKKGALISGQTSRKIPEAEAFRQYIKDNPERDLDYVTIHTMCNPSTSEPSREILGLIRDKETTTVRAFDRAMSLYGDLSQHIEVFDSVDDHDYATANTQINTSRMFLAIASAFAEAKRFPWLEGGYNSPIDAMKFSLAMRAANLPGHVYRGIQFGSPHGKQIVSHAMKVERELFELIVGNRYPEYRERVLRARDVLLEGRGLQPIISADALVQFGDEEKSKPNSHFSIIQYVVALAENGQNPFDDLRATTPMYTSLLCLVDSLLRNDAVLEKSIAAPFADPSLRTDDLVFHDKIRGWSNALMFDNRSAYDDLHNQMKERLDEFLLIDEVGKSGDIVRLTRESLQKTRK